MIKEKYEQKSHGFTLNPGNDETDFELPARRDHELNE